jgi:hypothetical protein
MCVRVRDFVICRHQYLVSSVYVKRLGMFPFKVQLFQGCKRETEPINTISVVQHVIRYQVLLAAYYKADTKYCCCRAKRRPFPVRLAFSMIIIKSQGQTFDKICFYLPKPVFSHGQLYVALSRARSLSSYLFPFCLFSLEVTPTNINC